MDSVVWLVETDCSLQITLTVCQTVLGTGDTVLKDKQFLSLKNFPCSGETMNKWVMSEENEMDMCSWMRGLERVLF